MNRPGARPNRGLPRGVRLLLAAAGLVTAVSDASLALAPPEILVVANVNARGSGDLAAHYMERRGIPAGNLLELRVTTAETCSREEYDGRIAAPVRQRLDADPSLRAAALLYGVPLRVRAPEPSAEERRTLARLEEERERLAEGQGAASGEDAHGGPVRERLETIRGLIREIRRADWEASVDSELALVRADGYPLHGWVANPAFAGSRGQRPPIPPEAVLLVSRLDGPSEAVVRRVIEAGLAAEAEGLRGRVYLDARWPDPGRGQELSGYALYDRSIHEAAAVLRGRGLSVVVDDRAALFPEGAALPAALYCGWYSLSRYVGAFAWQRGSVGYHIASGECVTLRGEGSQAWCKRMLEEGVAATLGPVGEPYLQAFPPPERFFDLLTDGGLTLAEAYYGSLPHLSWKMVLVGDPLYRPFLRR